MAAARLTRIPAIFAEEFRIPETTGQIGRVALPPTPAGPSGRRFVVRPHELDPMDHVNNAVYLDWLEEAILAAVGRGAGRTFAAVPRRYRLEYAAAADQGTELEDAAWRADDGTWSYRLTGSDGQDLFPGDPRTRRRAHDEDGVQRRARVRRHGSRSRRTPTSPSRTAGSSGSAPGSTGTARSTSQGGRSCPGFFDCHVHVTISDVDLWRAVAAAVLAPVLRGRPEPLATLRTRDHEHPRRRRRRPRDQGGGRARA